LDALTYAGSLENLKHLPDPGRHTFIHGDVCDRELVSGLFSDYRIDTVIHFAAESHVDRSILDPEPFIQTNVVGTYILLEAARRAWLVDEALPLGQVRFHHISTDEVFGSLGPDEPAFKETTNYAPNSPYAASKAASDHLVRAYHHTFQLPVTISNCSNNYGPYQFPEKLIPLMILNALQGMPLPVYGDGKQIRDVLYIDDLLNAYDAAIAHIDQVTGQVFNVGGGATNTLSIWAEFGPLLADLFGHEIPVKRADWRPGDQKVYISDIHKAQAELGWQPQVDVKTGVSRLYAWVAANQHLFD
ncbi:MAG TPA: dTDP-glucose 4,6-dehydratase, partial [Chloroflexi bacterium]|nr:dTDP-glucose 4,6-dehydratase [Chloroflexota bacterium]